MRVPGATGDAHGGERSFIWVCQDAVGAAQFVRVQVPVSAEGDEKSCAIRGTSNSGLEPVGVRYA